MKPAAKHPKTCDVCAGTGWQPGPPIHSTANGDPVIYTTVEPCQHPFWLDDPTVDEYGFNKVEPLAPGDPRALAAFEAGLRQGIAERDAHNREQRRRRKHA